MSDFDAWIKKRTREWKAQIVLERRLDPNRTTEEALERAINCVLRFQDLQTLDTAYKAAEALELFVIYTRENERKAATANQWRFKPPKIT